MSRNFNQSAIKSEFQSNSNTNKNIHFCFKYGFVFYCVKTKNFTNYFANESNFVEIINKLFSKDIPELSLSTFQDLKTQNRHYHKIEGNERKNVENIIKEILKEKEPNWTTSQISRFMEQILDTNIFQIGTPNGLRIIGTISSDIFEILFFDLYHLIYPNPKYNDQNYFSYSFSPSKRRDKN